MEGKFDVDDVIRRAEALRSLRRYDQALGIITDAIATQPADGALLAQLGLLQQFTGDLDASQLNLEAALALNPYDAAVFADLAVTRHLLGDKDGSLSAAHRAVSIDPGSAHTHLTLALASVGERGRGMTDLARASVGTAVSLAPLNANVYVAAADVFSWSGERSGGSRYIERGLELDPTNTDLLVYRSTAPESNQAAALSTLRGVLAEDPSHVEAQRSMADIMWKSLSRLGSGIWVALMTITVLSAWVGPAGLRHVVPVLFAVIIVLWLHTFTTLRRRLPPGYLRRRLVHRPEAILALLLTAFCALIGNLSPLTLLLANSSQGIGFGYVTMWSVVALTAVAHVVLQLSRVRRTKVDGMNSGRESDPDSRINSVSLCALVWLIVTAVMSGLLWATHSIAVQPHAGWAAAAIGLLVSAVYWFEAAAITSVFCWRRTRLLSIAAYYLPILAALGVGIWLLLSRVSAATYFT